MSSGQLLPEAHLFHVACRANSVLQSAVGEAGSCGASHMGWGGDFDPPPPSSSVFFCSECHPGSSFLRAASEACTSSAVLLCSSPAQALGQRGQTSVLQVETRGAWLRAFLGPGLWESGSRRARGAVQWLEIHPPKGNVVHVTTPSVSSSQ